MLSTAKKIVRKALPNIRRSPSLANEWLALQKYRVGARAQLSSSGKGKVALIGCGVMGAYLSKSVRLLTGWHVSELLDLDTAKANALQRVHAPKARVCRDIDELLASDFDVLVIATTAPSHAALVRKALDAGARKILLEKPVAGSLADADDLINRAAVVGATVQVDHSRRWGHSVRGLKRLLASGMIGRPVGAHFAYGRAGLAMIGTHLFDWTRLLFDAEFIRVSGKLDRGNDGNWRGAEFRDPSGRCDAELEGGLRVTIDLSSRLGYQQRYLTIFGDEGRIEVDEVRGVLSVLGAGRRRWESSYDWDAQRQLAVAEAVLEVHEGKSSRCSLADGRAALECCIACHVSDRADGAWIDLPLQGDIRSEAFPFA